MLSFFINTGFFGDVALMLLHFTSYESNMLSYCLPDHERSNVLLRVDLDDIHHQMTSTLFILEHPCTPLTKMQCWGKQAWLLCLIDCAKQAIWPACGHGGPNALHHAAQKSRKVSPTYRYTVLSK